MWCSRLPPNIQALIASQPSGALDNLADLADRVCDIVSPLPHVNACSTSAAQAAPGSSMEVMSREIAELKQAVKNLTMQLNRQGRNPERYNNRRRSRSRSTSNYEKFPTCWYHSKFGAKATKCTKPCDYGRLGNSQGSR
ncbi:uncharacterized protein LOC128199630 [Bicyclus anynana]|nr:uncharacterized protein LOC128199630 [Bicyclus anynana]